MYYSPFQWRCGFLYVELEDEHVLPKGRVSLFPSKPYLAILYHPFSPEEPNLKIALFIFASIIGYKPPCPFI
jgi:hypothetical protein